MRAYRAIPIILSASFSFSCNPIPDPDLIDKSIEYILPNDPLRERLRERSGEKRNNKNYEVIPNPENNPREIMLA